ncbi:MULTISPECIES: hypothetical protein [Myroides]|uniref:Uncharacterized protein n=1 Tax=Myroides albus TaxID=2562892 RepID=A0A6I3LEA6_9FLAO|nr:MULTISPECIES: hypothetical protein [Myroides]MTG97789.1 hypothetical protein [Myroides albus]MVX34879.1 hypothetical protein [Myroides sp. LoEW2-1]UVD79746.1 hypothetical protein NWE55_00175 [Myroides albus]
MKNTGIAYCGNFKPFVEYEIKKEKDIFNIYEICGTYAPYTVSSVILVDSIKLIKSVNVLIFNGQKTIGYSS